jgi:hypothetical protein
MGVAKKEHGRGGKGCGVGRRFEFCAERLLRGCLARGVGTIFGSGVGDGLNGRSSRGGGRWGAYREINDYPLLCEE